MSVFIKKEAIFLLFVRFIIVKSSFVEMHTYSRIANLDNRVTTDQPQTLFTGEMSLVTCILQCVSTPYCVSVFYSPSLCKGYRNVFSPTSPGLTTLSGAQYFVCEAVNLTSDVINKGTTSLSREIASTPVTTSNGSVDVNEGTTSVSTEIASTLLTTSNGGVDSCILPGYTWDALYNICYKLHTNELDAVEAKTHCQSENPYSRLLLIASDDTYNFAAYIVGTYDTGGIYLQGILSGSDFVDDDGQLITYFRWIEGEPGSGEYLCFDDVTKQQETCSGGSPNQFICRLYM